MTPALTESDTNGRLALVRTRLAHDRTMLAWIRTATSLITFGFGVHQVFRILPGSGPAGLRETTPIAFGTMMVGLGLAALILAALENRAATTSLTQGFPPSAGFPEAPRSYARIMGVLIFALGIAALIVMHPGT